MAWTITRDLLAERFGATNNRVGFGDGEVGSWWYEFRLLDYYREPAYEGRSDDEREACLHIILRWASQDAGCAVLQTRPSSSTTWLDRLSLPHSEAPLMYRYRLALERIANGSECWQAELARSALNSEVVVEEAK